MSKKILISGIFFSIILRIFFALNGSDVADIKKLHQISEVILEGNNPYKAFDFTIYPPIGYYLESATLFVSSLLGIPFHILTKLWPNFADIAIGLLLYKFLIKLKTKPTLASIWSLVFILNPISIIISSAHGQIDSISSFLVLLTIYVIYFHTIKFYSLLSAALLGLAISIKPNPVMLLPFFLIFIKEKLKGKIIFTLVTLAPMTISLAPYFWQSSREVINNVFGYSGVYDLGYAAILRGFWYQKNASIWLPLSVELLEASKIAFLAGMVFLLLLFLKSKDLIKACFMTYLLFIGIYFGISAQYLTWILPFAVLLKDKVIIPFSIAGTIALFGFYTYFGPEILFGKFWIRSAFQNKYMLVYFCGNLFLWIVTILWIIKIINNQIKISFENINPLNKKILIVSLIIFTISLMPVLQLFLNTVKQSF